MEFRDSSPVILGIHPFGSTELYDDGAQYLEHVSAFWIVIHLAATPLLFGFPLVICQLASLILFFQAAQHTTASETGVFRVGVTLLIGLIGVMAWELRRGPPSANPPHVHRPRPPPRRAAPVKTRLYQSVSDLVQLNHSSGPCPRTSGD
ncbi:MAG: hypothetical protein OES24_00615 [Acidimicrobiia bacterium]|nr:hypothetical protein [Acidimicrobiia bacterium]